MIVLHASIFEDEIYFWAEVPPKEAEGDSTTNVKETGKPMLPYDAGEDHLRDVIASTLFDGSIRKLPTVPMTVWIPTAGKTPISSSPLITDAKVPSKSKLALKPWTVTTVRLGIANTISFLSACINTDVLKSGIVVGPDLDFFTKAVRFAGALVARQQYLPDIITNDGEFTAIWDPIFLGSDKVHLEEFTTSMPHACQAMSVKGSPKSLPQIQPGLIMTTFIVQVVDYVARYTIFEQGQGSWIKDREASEDGDFDSIHDHWLHALVSEDPMMQDQKKEIKELQDQIRAWRRPIALSTSSPFRLCLCLEEPKKPRGKKAAANPKWYVHFFLQSMAQRDVLIPADHVWNPTPEEEKLLNVGDFHAKEFLLSSLGKASAICPRIELSLETDAPDGYQIDTEGAYEFLTERAVALDQAGFGVRTPDWWTPRGCLNRLGTRAIIKLPKKSTEASMDQVLDFEWEVTLQGKTIDLKELKVLSATKVPLVNLRELWIELHPEDMERALEIAETRLASEGTLRDIVQMALGSARIPGNFQFEGIVASGWVKEFLDQLEGGRSFEELEPPKGFMGELRPYQSRGYSWLYFLKQWGLGSCLADDMGLGKTIQALTLIQREWNDGNRRPVLIICPTSLTGNWFKEAQRFIPDLPVMVHHGVTRKKGDDFIEQVATQCLVISSYSLLHRDIEVIKKIHWKGVILDEAQNIKNPKTKQARSARQINATYRIALTGTPVENNVGDLWSIMEFLNPNFLGTQAEFKRNFLVPIQATHDKDAINRLKKLTGPFILRRLKNDKTIIKDLPGKLEMKVYCTLTKEQAALYESLVHEVEVAIDSAEGIQRKGLVLSTLTKLKQICNHPAHYLGDGSKLPDRSGKLSRLTEMLEEVISLDERALVFTQFVEMGKLAQAHLQETFKKEVIFLHGGVPKKKRDEMIERFQTEEDGPNIFILSLKAGGTGLNLMRANHVFHYDRWWNPAVEDQATDRVYRIGQSRNVQVHKFLCAGTLEERIDDMIESKKDIASNIVGSGENWLTELSTNELKNLFALQKDAVGE